MKKSVKKTLSAVLALVLILSALPMAAFAAEEAGVAPASIICKDGEHIYALEGAAIYTNMGTHHHVKMCDACVVCLTPRSDTVYGTYDEAHSYTTVTQFETETGITVYCYSCKCGASYYV